MGQHPDDGDVLLPKERRDAVVEEIRGGDRLFRGVGLGERHGDHSHSLSVNASSL